MKQKILDKPINQESIDLYFKKGCTINGINIGGINRKQLKSKIKKKIKPKSKKQKKSIKKK